MSLKISTKGRYALRVLVDLAEHDDGTFLPLGKVAERQDISEKYLEAIISSFVKAGVVKGRRGKGGGYKMAVDPKKYTVLEALKLVEGDLSPVICLGDHPKHCNKLAECKTRPMWKTFYDNTLEYFGGIAIADLI